MTKTIAEIWEGDLFNRQEEAINLEAYIESIWQRPSAREDSKGFVLAVDADYGMGKTFFLKRFAEQLAINHPVAYVDAWKDDLQDEPLIALIATLEKALEEAFGTSNTAITKAKGEVLQKFKKVAGIVGKGLLKKVAGLIITASAAESVSKILEGQDEDIKESVEKGFEEVGKEITDGVASISKVIAQNSNLEERINDFREGQQAIEDLKTALCGLVNVVTESGKQAPIVIIIDELDRCRPNYAIKLLEEVKHLFDVEGVVFILSTNLQQLGHSVSKVYGNSFNGFGYLSRFTDRVYKFNEIQLKEFISANMAGLNLKTNCFYYPRIGVENKVQREFAAIVSELFNLYGFSPRASFKALLSIETATLTSNQHLILLPWLIRELAKLQLGKNEEELNRIEDDSTLFCVTSNDFDNKIKKIRYIEYISIIREFLASDKEQIDKNAENDIFWEQLSQNFLSYRRKDYGLMNLQNYAKLVNVINRIGV